MKKLLLSLLVLACVAPATAATITFGTPDTSVGGQVTIPWTADAGVVGIALTVDASAGVIDDVAVDSFFDVFIDSAFTIGAGYQIGDGIPTATQDAPGELALPSASFSISVGGLDDDGIGAGAEEAPLSGSIILQSDAGATIDVCEDTLRGGVVGYDGAMTIVGLCKNITIAPPGPPPCRDRLTAGERTLYDAYVAAGKDPSCWCNQYQCRGDINNAVDLPAAHWRIYTADLGILALATNWKKGPATGANPCADINHISDIPAAGWSIYTGDLGVLAGNWRKGGVGEGSAYGEVAVCPGYVAP